MTNNSIKIALYLQLQNVREKIANGRFYVVCITNNAAVFTSPNPVLATITIALDALSAAADDAIKGGTDKTKTVHDLEKALDKLLKTLAHYVEDVAGGDEAIIHLAGMDIVIYGTKATAEFKAKQGLDHGQVTLQVKARTKTMYKWQYSANTGAGYVWLDAGMSRVCKKMIDHLAPGLYWFRVIFLDENGEHEGDAFSFAVN